MASRIVSLISLSCVMTPIAMAQAPSHEEFTCTFGSDSRTVSVVKADAAREPKACRVDYTRNGRPTTLWSSKTGYAYCVAKAASLVTKLAEGHYSCKPPVRRGTRWPRGVTPVRLTDRRRLPLLSGKPQPSDSARRLAYVPR
jgi:hypothetical protein